MFLNFFILWDTILVSGLKLLIKPKVAKILHCFFSPQIFYSLHLTCKSTIPFDLIFMYHSMIRSIFFAFAHGYPVVQGLFIEVIMPLPLNCFCAFVKKQLAKLIESSFGRPICSIDPCVYLCSNTKLS